MNHEHMPAPAHPQPLRETDESVARLLSHLTPPGTSETPPAVLLIKAHYPSARQALQDALQFAHWLEDRGQQSQRAHRIEEGGPRNFFAALFGKRGPISAPDEQVERALEEISTHVSTVESLAETVMRTMMDAETTVLRLVARRDAAQLLAVVERLCQQLDEYGTAAGALGALPSAPADGA